MRFGFVVRGRNCAKYLHDCMHSIVKQPVDWRAHIILDPSKDTSVEVATKYMCNRVKVTYNREVMGVGRNMYSGIAGLHDMAPEDVVCIVDADDYLLDNALARVEKEYRKRPNLMSTYGSFILGETRKKSRICKPYKKGEVVRKARWRATHLKTFKRGLLDKIPKEYLDVDAASDLAIMFAVLELAGLDRSKHIEQPLYYYRNKTPGSLSRDKQRKWERRIRRMKSLKRC